MATIASSMTAEQFAALPDGFEGPVELVKGHLIEMDSPAPRHGVLCLNIGYFLRRYLDEHPIGRVASNDSCVITARDPDSVRGSDISYYSHETIPPGPFPAGLLKAVPELVFEVLSPHDRWSAVHAKVAEYLQAGVRAVCVLDDSTRSLHFFHADKPVQLLTADEDLTLPEILPAFRVRVGKLLE